MGKSTSFIITLSNLISSITAFSNNFGSDIAFTIASFVFIGANLVFDKTNEQCGPSVLRKNFKYATILYKFMTHCKNVTGYLKCCDQVHGSI